MPLRKISFVLTAALAQISAAQDNDDSIFLVASMPDAGVVNYIGVWQEDYTGIKLRKSGPW